MAKWLQSITGVAIIIQIQTEPQLQNNGPHGLLVLSDYYPVHNIKA